MNRRTLVFVVLMLMFASPMAVLADEPVATPPVVDDPTIGNPGVPSCDDMPEGTPWVDCVPSPGPKPPLGGFSYSTSDGRWDCEVYTVEVMRDTRRITGYVVNDDNTGWVPIIEANVFDSVVIGYRPMTNAEIADCGPAATPTDDGGEPPSTPEVPVDPEEPQPVATEEPTQEPQMVDDTSEEIVVDQPVEVAASPEQGDGTAGGESVSSPAFQAGAQAATAIIAAAQAAVK